MGHLKSKNSLIAIGVAVSFSSLLGACAQDADRNPTDQVGTISATLLTTGSDGSLYRFPAGSFLLVTSSTGRPFHDEFALDADSTVLNVTLPVDSYRVEVEFNGQLERTVPGANFYQVPATWTDPQPVNITIAQDTTLSLMLHFQALGLVDITFDQGGLAVALQVERFAKQTPASYIDSGSYTNQSEEFGPSASAALQAALGMTSGESHTYFLQYDFLGPWAQRTTTRVCAPVQLNGESFNMESAFSRAIAAFHGQPAILCIEDDGANDAIVITSDREGAAPFVLESVLPGTNYHFALAVDGLVGDVYDGRAFSQSELERSTVLSSGALQHLIVDQDSGERLVYALGSLTTNVRLVPGPGDNP
jgi:hypothetical protein